MKNRLVVSATVILTIFAVCILESGATSRLPIVRIGVVRDASTYGRFPDVFELIKREILTLTTGQFEVCFPPDK